MVDGKHIRKDSAHATEMAKQHGLSAVRHLVPRCPRVIAAKRCLVTRNLEDALRGGPRRACICQRYWTILDHARIWRDSEGRRVLTSEPYSADGQQLAAFLTETSELGLQVDVSGRSTWNPGATLLLQMIRR